MQNQIKESLMSRKEIEKSLEIVRSQLQSEIANCAEEKAKVKEMEHVIAVCQNQISNFDHVSMMSQCVIERLER